jgi:hypothetical protein
MGKIKLPFIDSDLLYRGALKGRFDYIENFLFLNKYKFGREMPEKQSLLKTWISSITMFGLVNRDSALNCHNIVVN